MSRRPVRVLVVSPVASHPADQGNSARIQALGAALMARGLVCEFLYYTAEGLTPAQRAAMAGFWHALHLHPAEPVGEPGLPGAWALDDWCPPSLAERVAALQRAGRYDAVLVNYVWMSRTLEGVAGGGALKVVDTHDLFGDRHLIARAQGLDPSWFFTTCEEEARGLDRADLVLAIQEEEAAALRARTARPVLTLGHMPEPRFLTDAEVPAPRAMFGYFGSANPWNAASVRALDAALLAGAGAGAPDLPWLLAGRILGRRDLALASAPLPLDPVPEPSVFYRVVDCVLNPMTGGTGLKVKTVEALAYGRPVLGTRDAFAGLPAEHPGHAAADAAEVVALMRDYAGSDAFRRELRRASRLLALRYAAEVAAQADALAARLSPGGGA